MKDFKLGNDVYIMTANIFGIVTAVFYHDDVKDKIIFEKELDQEFPGWRKKAVYVITCYSDNESGSKFLAVHDTLTLTSELN